MVTKVSLKRYTMSMEKNPHVQNRNRCTLARQRRERLHSIQVYNSTPFIKMTSKGLFDSYSETKRPWRKLLSCKEPSDLLVSGELDSLVFCRLW